MQKLASDFSSKNRVIFSAEWTYLLTERKVGDEDSAFSFVRIKYGDHETDTVTGVIIYPDDFSFSEVGVSTMKFGSRSNRLQAELDKATWESLESAGCVFIPFVPSRNYKEGRPTINEEYYGQSLSISSADAYNASSTYYCTFSFTNASPVTPNNYGARYFGMPVRLVQDYTKK